MLPETPRGRLRWAIDESLIFLGILVFWIVVVGVVTVLLAVLALPYQLLGGPVFRPLVEIARLGGDAWAAVLPLTVVTSSLYAIVRGGTLLIDYYLEGASG